MKKLLTLLMLFVSLALQTQLLAQSFIIKGTVTDENKRPIVGKTVYISSESTVTGCNIQRKVVTNPNGYYIDSIRCTGEIKYINVQTTDCNNRLFLHRMVPGSTRVIESNFVLCGSSVVLTACRAAFKFAPITNTLTTAFPFAFLFTSGESEVNSGDSIVSRTWMFGDRTQVVTGNEATIRHQFPGSGTYQVTLFIKTLKGCESKITNSVVVKEQPCAINTKVFIKRQADRYFQFSSVEDNLAPGDTIIKRSWNFGDGSILDGNEISPIKRYADTGSFKVCLQFKTKYGCYGESCLSIRVKDSLQVNTSCKAFFTVQSDGLTVFVNSNGSSAGSFNNTRKDSIISRTWYINDSLAEQFTTTNPVDFRKTFTKAGTYTITLVIKTAGGCVSKYAQTITLLGQTCNLSTKVVVLKNSGLQYVFGRNYTNNFPGDSIISTSWRFSDGTSLDGNVENPYKQFKQAGKYTICAISKTQKGCVSEACITIDVKDSVITPTDCKAYFSYQVKDLVVYLNSARSLASSGAVGTQADSIVSRIWHFGDTVRYPVAGNQTEMKHAFTKPGTYPVILYIKTRLGCESKFISYVVIPPVECRFDTKIGMGRHVGLVYEFVNPAHNLPAGDSIVKRTWHFGDGTSTDGNNASPIKFYTKPGKYTVCLVAKSLKGCISENCIDVTIIDSVTQPSACKASVSYRINGNIVYFNSSASVPSVDGTNSGVRDSIISRTWYFGDNAAGTPGLSGNEVETKYQYLKPGTYTAYLVIKTKKGCESKFSVTFIIGTPQPECRAMAEFKFEQAGKTKIQFASGSSSAVAGDSITQRIWSFGDNTVMTGNIVNPVKEYRLSGSYKVCLQVKTAKGCKADVCKEVKLPDTLNTPSTNITYIKIITINPNPVQSKMAVTVWSKLPDMPTEFTIYDVNGNPKMSFKKTLMAGNNTLEIYADRLTPGLYFLRVANAYGKDSMQFYKQ
jgi:PKD repeat protein